MKNLKDLTRPNIWSLTPYSSARDEYKGEDKVTFLDANENPYSDPYNRYPDPGQRELKKAISIDPDNSNASYWKEILSYSTYYRMIEQADKLLEQNNVKAASALYLKATNILKDSPYAYVGLTRCAVLDKDEPSFEKYSNLAITNSKKESDFFKLFYYYIYN